jgi:hypothetical protein
MSILKKIIIFLIPICMLIGLNNHYSNAYRNELEVFGKHKTYFIGSSRVQRGIDPKILNDHSNETKIYNLGISGSTFLHNLILAEHMIEKYKAAELFIELSPIQFKINDTHTMLGIVDFFSIIKNANVNNFFETMESYLFQKFSLRNSIKQIILPNNNESAFGYVFASQNSYDKTDSFLKIEDLGFNSNYDITSYSKLISELNKVAFKNHTKIRYFLPLTFKREEERKIVTAVFNSLASEQKVFYTNEFLESIRNSDNLFDKNHFNDRGAKIMTLYFKSKYFSKRGSSF